MQCAVTSGNGAISRGLDSLFSVDSGGIRSNEDYPEDDVYNR